MISHGVVLCDNNKNSNFTTVIISFIKPREYSRYARVRQTDNQILCTAFNSFTGCKQYCVRLRRLDVGR